MFTWKGRPWQKAALFLFITARLASAQSPQQVADSQRAKGFLAEGRFADAARIYQSLVDALPANTGLRMNLGLALHMAGEHAKAIPHLETVLQAQPAALPALLSLGTALLQVNQPARAVGPLTKAVALQPDNIDARGMLANALLSLNRAAEAAPHFRRMAALTPADPRVWSGLGKCYELLAGQTFEAMDKASAEWLSLVAETRLIRGQNRAAFYFYRQALEKKPSMRGLHAALAKVYQGTGNPEWAAAEEAKEKSLPRANCALEKAECDFAAGRYLDAASGKSAYWRVRAYNELATRSFAQLGKLAPSVDLHLLKAEIASQRGQMVEAAAEYAAATRLVPGDARLEREYAVALYFARDYEKARPLLERAMLREPANAEIYFFIGDSYLRQEKPEQALASLRAAIAYDAKLLPAHAALGQALARLDKPVEAIPHLVVALPIDEDGSLHYQLSRAYQGSGETAKARETLAKYQQIRQKLDAEKRGLEEQVKITAPQ